jgi:ribosome-binding factor A
MPRRKSSASASRAPSNRPLRVGEEIRHTLAAVLARGELRDPVLSGISITVSEVRMSPDLMRATAFVAPLGGAEDLAEIIKALNRAAPYLRGQVVREVKLRRAPEIGFVPDTSFDYAHRIDSVLRAPGVRRDLGSDEET